MAGKWIEAEEGGGIQGADFGGEGVEAPGQGAGHLNAAGAVFRGSDVEELPVGAIVEGFPSGLEALSTPPL